MSREADAQEVEGQAAGAQKPGRWEALLQAAQFHLMRLLPTEWASALGSFAVRMNVRRNRPDILAGASRNLRIHRPDATAAEIDAMIVEFLDGVGRVMGEFSVMHRFIREDRLKTIGLEAFKAVAGTRPIIAFGLHTGNWETFGPLFQHEGVPLASFYMPPADAFERKVAEASRAEFGVRLLSPDARGVRDAMRLLKHNDIVMILPDEALGGRVLGPLFGRPAHDKGNLAIAARLARHTGAAFVICHSRRTAPCRFLLEFSPLFELPPASGRADTLADVAFLNARIEPIVLENIPRWYFLDDSIQPLD
jgi:KDO2-lipid IV(A) lauroyltransferase